MSSGMCTCVAKEQWFVMISCSGKYNCVHKALVRVALHGDKSVKDRVDDDFTSKQYVDPANDDNGT